MILEPGKAPCFEDRLDYFSISVQQAFSLLVPNDIILLVKKKSNLLAEWIAPTILSIVYSLGNNNNALPTCRSRELLLLFEAVNVPNNFCTQLTSKRKKNKVNTEVDKWSSLLYQSYSLIICRQIINLTPFSHNFPMFQHQTGKGQVIS